MRKYSFFAIFIAILLVLCLPVYSYADYIINRVTFLAITMNSGDNATYKTCKVTQLGDGLFTVSPDVTSTQSPCTNFRFYIGFGVGYVDSFDLVITMDHSALSNVSLADTSTSMTNTGVNCDLVYWNGSTVTAYNNIKTVAKISREVGTDISTYRWTYVPGSTQENRNGVMVTIPYNTFVSGPGELYQFHIERLTINGVAYDLTEVTEYNTGFADTISELSANEDEWWQQVVLPGYEDYFDNTQVNEAMSDYKLVIKEVSFNNFLVPGLIVIVFTFAFYGFVLFGKKG